jgi:hypothetical protein
VENLADPADVPLEGVPDWNRLEEDRVHCAERDRDDRIERDQEEEEQPQNARKRESGPKPPPIHRLLLNLRR